jgi:hypothetical protein
MIPVKFKEQNCTYAENQKEYLPLPAHRTEDGRVVSCWKMNWRERLHVLFTGKIWWSVLTFNHPLQPQVPDVRSPFIKEVTHG